MTKLRGRETLAQVAVLGVIAVLGTGAILYVLSNQGDGAPNPFRDTYDVRVELGNADGVRAGIGQPVNVAGVRVGGVVGVATAASGNALVTMQIERDQLPHVYADATAGLEPITPLKDLRVELDPGGPPAHVMSDGGTIAVSRTSTPVPLSALLASLDSDTRPYLTSLLASLDQGTRGAGPGLRKALRSLGPTSSQLGRLSTSLAARRRELARLVHNVAIVTRAASRDRRLAAVVQAGNATLAAIADNDVPLRDALARLPASLQNTDQTLSYAARFANEVGPTVDALTPATNRLPRTLDAIHSFADTTTATVGRDIRPFVRDARPLVRDAGRATPRLAALEPHTTHALQSLNYLANVMAYNPPGKDEGGLFWTAWFGHNWNSLMSMSDAHGAIARTVPIVACGPVQGALAEVQKLAHTSLGLEKLCP